MSRLAKKPTIIPNGVEVSLNEQTLSVKGPKGTLTRNFDLGIIGIEINGNEITFTKKKETPFSKALWGTYASHVKNMIIGVNEGYTKKLILEGVGFKSDVSGDILNLALGFSHPVKMEIPGGLKVKVEENTRITVSGFDKSEVGQFAASIRKWRPPEPYKGKGFRYTDEIIRRKVGKAAKSD